MVCKERTVREIDKRERSAGGDRHRTALRLHSRRGHEREISPRHGNWERVARKRGRLSETGRDGDGVGTRACKDTVYGGRGEGKGHYLAQLAR